MSPWDAAFAASGLAASNTQLYMGLGLLLYMNVSVYLLHCCLRNDEKANEVRWKRSKLKEEDIKKRGMEDFFMALQEDLSAGRHVSFFCFMQLPFDQRVISNLNRSILQGSEATSSIRSMQRFRQEMNHFQAKHEETVKSLSLKRVFSISKDDNNNNKNVQE
jgi:hypothetical protein